MDEQFSPEKKETQTTTATKLGVGVKVSLTMIVAGAVVAGVYAALALAQ